MIYLDTSVALAWLLAEDRQPPASLWDETLVSSRLIEYEIWTALHARELADSHSEAARGLVGRVALLELSPRVLARALDAFSGGSWAAADPGRPASGVVRVSGGSGPGHGTRELRPADERCRPRDGYSALRSGMVMSHATGVFFRSYARPRAPRATQGPDSMREIPHWKCLAQLQQ